MPPSVNDHRDGPRDECGVFGIYAPGHDVASLAYFALFALQHRGQESAGIATAPRGREIMAIRDQGLVAQVFDEHKLRSLVGDMAIGHVRYSTTGASEWENTQPIVRNDRRTLALAHNGNLINAVELHAELREHDVAVQLDVRLGDHRGAARDAIRLSGSRTRWPTCCRACGARSRPWCMTEESVVAFRDPHGLRPLVLGMIEDEETGQAAYCVASESCAFDLIGATYLREVLPGEVITLTDGGVQTRMVGGSRAPRVLRVRVHLLRPPGLEDGGHGAAGGARRGWARSCGARPRSSADLVIPVPDSGNPAARGLARAAGLPQDDGFIKNRYVARTFIQPGQELRRHGLRLKFNPLPEVVAGKRLIVVDDSIVRGNTTRQIVQMLRDAGAAEIHLRISAPPIKHPCHYGIDMSTREEMIAHGRTVEEIADELGADSLHYLSLEGVYEAVGVSTRDALRRVLQRRVSARRHRGGAAASTRSSSRSLRA